MLIDRGRQLAVGNRVCLLFNQRVNVAADRNVDAGEASLGQQRLEPRRELLVEIVEKHDAGRGNDGDIGGSRLVRLATAAGFEMPAGTRPSMSFTGTVSAVLAQCAGGHASVRL